MDLNISKRMSSHTNYNFSPLASDRIYPLWFVISFFYQIITFFFLIMTISLLLHFHIFITYILLRKKVYLFFIYLFPNNHSNNWTGGDRTLSLHVKTFLVYSLSYKSLRYFVFYGLTFFLYEHRNKCRYMCINECFLLDNLSTACEQPTVNCMVHLNWPRNEIIWFRKQLISWVWNGEIIEKTFFFFIPRNRISNLILSASRSK